MSYPTFRSNQPWAMVAVATVLLFLFTGGLSAILGQLPKKPRVDAYGDPLPPHALVRLGTIRLRHGSPATALAFSADGKRLVSVANNLETHVWDVATSKEILYRKGESKGGSVVLSQDGKWLAVIKERSCELRDVASGKLLHTLDGHEGLVKRACFSPDGKLLATAADNGEVDLWEAATGKKRWHYRHSNYSTNRMFISFTSDGKILLYDDGEGSLLKLGGIAGKVVYRRPAGKEIGGDECLITSPDGKFYFTCYDQRRLGTVFLLKESKSGKKVHEFILRHHWFAITSFSRDGSNLAIGDDEGNIWLWNAATKKIVCGLTGHRRAITAVTFSPHGKLLASCSGDNTVRLWRVTIGKERFARRGHQLGGISVSFGNNGRYLLSRSCKESNISTLYVWDAATGKLSRSIVADFKKQQWFEPFLKPARIVVQERDGTVRVVNACDYKTLLSMKLPSIHACQMTPDGSRLTVLVSEPPLQAKSKKQAGKWSVQIWNVNTGKRAVSIRGIGLPNRRRFNVFLSPDKRTIVVADAANVLGYRAYGPDYLNKVDYFLDAASEAYHFLDAASGKNKGRIELADGLSLHSFTACARFCRIESWDGLRRTMKVFWWDVNRARKVAGSDREISLCGEMCQSNNRKLLASAKLVGSRTMFCLSELQSDQSVYQQKTPTSNTLRAAVFSPDDRIVAVGSSEGEIFLYDVINRKRLGELTGHRGEITSLSFSPDGRRLASGSDDTTILIWDLAPFWKMRDTAPIQLDAKKLDNLWQQLAHKDAAKAYEAIGLLVRGSKQSVPFLRQKLQPVRAVKPAVIQKAIADLDSNKFAVREKAARMLVKLNDVAEPVLRKALAKNLTLEVHLRIERILTQMEKSLFEPERLRQLRALQALEWIGNKEARELLARLASGVEDAWLTAEARVSLENVRRIARKGG